MASAMRNAIDDSETAQRRLRWVGLLVFFPLGFWLAPWMYRQVRGGRLSRTTQNVLLSSIGVGTAVLWNVGLIFAGLLALYVWLFTNMVEQGYWGQDMQEQWAVKGCLRQVRDGKLVAVEECNEYARINLQFYANEFEGLSSAADKLCIASLAHLRHGHQWYGRDADVIPNLTDEAVADCTDVRINANDVVTRARGLYGDDEIVNDVLRRIPN